MLHVAAVVGIYLFSLWHGKPPADQVMWLDGGSVGGGNPGDDAAPAAIKTSHTETTPEPPPEQEPSPPPPPPAPAVEKTAPSELVTPDSTPQPHTPKPEVTPKPETPRLSTPRPATPKPTPHHTPKPKPATPKSTPKPKPKATPSEDQGDEATPKPKTAADTKLKDTFKEAKNEGAHDDADGTADSPGATPGKSGGNGSGTGNGKGSGKAGGGSGTSQFGWYFSMIHDRFHSRWDQPTSIDRSGQDIVTTLKIKIAKDGTILSREIVKSSGETVMDQSVMTAAERVQQIDPLPAGLGNGDTYEVNIAFKLEQNQ